MGPLFAYLNIPTLNQVYVIFLARLMDLDFFAGAESLEVQLFDEHQIPWEEIAFPKITNNERDQYSYMSDSVNNSPRESSRGSDTKRIDEDHSNVAMVSPLMSPPPLYSANDYGIETI